MADNDAFRLSLAAWADKVPDKLEAVGRVAIQDLCEAVIDDTRIDTGFLVGNWQPSLKPPGSDVVEQPEEFAGKEGGEADKGRSIAKLAGVIPQLKGAYTFWMTNNANYARYREFGTSTQVGDLMVQRNLARWRQFVEGAIVKLGLNK
jgi:hypothetical protein